MASNVRSILGTFRARSTSLRCVCPDGPGWRQESPRRFLGRLYMYQLLRSANRELLIQQLPIFVISFVIASLFYRFGSFALECVAFLATWFVLDLVTTLLRSLVS